MDIKDLKLLIKLVTETDITEFEMDNSDEKIIIKRGHKPEYVTVAAPAVHQYAPPGCFVRGLTRRSPTWRRCSRRRGRGGFCAKARGR